MIPSIAEDAIETPEQPEQVARADRYGEILDVLFADRMISFRRDHPEIEDFVQFENFLHRSGVAEQAAKVMLMLETREAGEHLAEDGEFAGAAAAVAAVLPEGESK
jgi:hypothetical protein